MVYTGMKNTVEVNEWYGTEGKENNYEVCVHKIEEKR